MTAGIPGYEAEPAETEAVAGHIIEDIAAAWPGDPLPRYAALTSWQAHHQAVSGRLADARAAVIAQMHSDGMSHAQIAVVTGLTRGRIQQLVEKGREFAVTGEFDLLARPARLADARLYYFSCRNAGSCGVESAGMSAACRPGG